MINDVRALPGAVLEPGPSSTAPRALTASTLDPAGLADLPSDVDTLRRTALTSYAAHVEAEYADHPSP